MAHGCRLVMGSTGVWAEGPHTRAPRRILVWNILNFNQAGSPSYYSFTFWGFHILHQIFPLRGKSLDMKFFISVLFIQTID